MAAKLKIDEGVLEAVKSVRKRTSYQKRLDALVDMMVRQEMTLPIYQRDVSWGIEKCIELFDFQLYGKALISPISVHEFKVEKDSVKQVDFISRDEIDLSNRENETILSLVDGQQRLTTNYKAYIGHRSFNDIVFDISRGKFRLNKGKTVLRSCIPVGILYNQDEQKLEKYLRDNGTFDQLYSILIKMRSRWAEYQYTLNIATDMSESEQIKWFEVLNNAGSRVTDIQIKLSKLKLKDGEDFDIYKTFTKKFVCKLLDKFPDLEKNFRPFTTRVSYPIASLNPAFEILVRQGKHKANFATIPSDEKSELLISENKDVLNKISELTLYSLDKALNFIEEFNLIHVMKRMDYILYLVGYFTFLQSKNFDEKRKSELLEWVNSVDFTNKTNHERRVEYKVLIEKAK